jgi:hypothetical protein
LTIRCDEILNRGQEEIVSRLADQVGYFPVFASFSALSQFADTIISSTTGAKTGDYSKSEYICI